MKNKISQLILILMLLASNLLLAKPGVEASNSGPDFATSKFQQTVVDMRVKVAGGYLTHSRYLSGSIWQFNPNWAKLEASYEDGVLSKITRNRYEYKRSGSQSSPTWAFDERNYITKNILGFRWQDRKGNWIEYDNDGYSTSFGDLNGTTATLIRDDKGQLNTVQDRNGKVIFTYTYESHGWLKEVTDYSGRKITYTWEENDIPVKQMNFRGAVIGGNLLNVNDVRGKNWQYSYSSPSFYPVPVLTSMTDPNGNVTNIQFGSVVTGGSSTGGSSQSITYNQPYVCADWAGGEWVQNEATKEWEFKNYRCITKIQQSSVRDIYQGFSGNVGDWQYLGQPDLLSKVSDQIGLINSYQFRYNTKKEEFTTVIQDADGGMMATTYNLDGETSETIKNGRVYSQRTISGNSSTIYDQNGNKTTVVQDQFKNPVSITYADGSKVSLSWNTSISQVTQYVDENGNQNILKYDSKGNLIQVQEAVGSGVARTTDITYNSQGYPETFTLPQTEKLGSAIYRMSSYDSFGNLTKLTDSLDYEHQYLEHDVLGNPKRTIDANGNTWNYTYDNAGNLLSVISPLGFVTSYEYDNFGNMVKIIDANNKSTQFKYDQRNRVIESIDPLGGTLSVSYNGRGQITSVSDELGRKTFTEYDLDGNQIKTVNQSNHSIENNYGYNTLDRFKGLVNSVQYPTFSSSFKYDSRNRPIESSVFSESTETKITQYEFDKVGNITKVIHPDNYITSSIYDALNRPDSVTDAGGGVTKFDYDKRNSLSKVTNANDVVAWEYEYDQRGRLVQEIYADGAFYEFQYDGNDNLTLQVDAKGQVTKYTYDADNRQTAVEYYNNLSDSIVSENLIKSISFSYDNLGNLIGYVQGDISSIYTYDDLSRILTTSSNYEGIQSTSSYTYYANGLVKSFTGPDGLQVQYTYDNANQLLTYGLEGEGTITINEYDWLAPASIAFPGGAVQNNSFDGFLRPLELEQKNNQDEAVYSTRYDYSVTNNITTKWITSGSLTNEKVFDYDSLDQLTLTNEINQPLTYDLVGNQLGSVETNTDSVYDSRNRLIRRGSSEYDYDLNGSLVSISDVTNGLERSFEYDLQNRLSKISDPSGNVVSEYLYDPFGRRISKTHNGQRTWYFYSEEGLIAEIDESGLVTTAYGYVPQTLWGTGPVYIRQNNQVGYYYNDRIGTPVQIRSAAGELLWEAEYEAFGNAAITQNTITNNLRFPGQYYDAESELHYNYFRYYDPEVGRYITSDPIGIYGGLNPYLYAHNNALIKFDPTGEIAPWVAYVVGSALVGAIEDIVIQTVVNTIGNIKDPCWQWNYNFKSIGISALSGIVLPGYLDIFNDLRKIRIANNKFKTGLNQSRNKSLSLHQQRVGLRQADLYRKPANYADANALLDTSIVAVKEATPIGVTPETKLDADEYCECRAKNQ